MDEPDRESTQRALRVSEERFRAIFESTPSGILLVDADGRIVLVNAQVEALFGHRRDELLGQPVEMLVPLPLRERHVADRQRYLAGPEARPMGIRRDFAVQRKDGSEVEVEIGLVPISGPGGTMVLANIVDISDRRRAEAALRLSTDRLVLFVDHAPAAIAMFDTEMRYIAASRRWLDDYGLSGRDIRGLSHYEVFPEIPERWKEIHRRCLAGAVERAEEDRFERADGTVQWLRWEIQPWRQAGGAVGGLFMFTEDINQRKQAAGARRRLEAQLRHAQRLESLGVVAGGIAHDFNNLLSGILGYCDLALLEVADRPKAHQRITEAIHGVRRAAELTDQLLAYSGKGRFVTESVDLSRLIAETTRLLEVSIPKKCELRYRFTPDLPAVEADAAQLRQVAMNLVLNAAEAIGDHAGVITVTTGVMQCDAAYFADAVVAPGLPGGRYVFLDVADTGRGMSAETMARLFDPFFSTKAGGLGLGLSAALGIVRGHQGAIKVASDLGRGTTMRILLPASHLPAPAPEADEAAAAAWRSTGTALVVEDFPAVRELARSMLATLGFEVLTAGDGREALEIFARRGEEIRFVLLDMTMPNLDGEETFRELQRLRPGLKTILSSGYNEESAIRSFAGGGPAAFIKKPYRLPELQAVVRRVLESD